MQCNACNMQLALKTVIFTFVLDRPIYKEIAKMEELETFSNEHQLLINLSSAGDGNIFSQLPEILNKMLAPEVLVGEGLEDEFNMVLPSDYNWRMKIYFKLLKKIRDNDQDMFNSWSEENEPVQLHHWNIVPKTTCITNEVSQNSRKESVAGPPPITWTVNDIAKAASLLSTPSQRIHFDDEQEMRRVYTLIYDTYRYKGILNQALNDISFYQLYPQFEKLYTRVWMLLFDLYHRSFKKRESAVATTATELFKSVKINSIENALWEQRVKLAAAVARLRIKNSALNLNDLLPKHLRKDPTNNSSDNSPVTCWINRNKVKNDEEIILALERALCLKNIDNSASLSPNSYKWDQICPNFLTFHHSLRTILARSYLVQKHKLIVQDRSFCLGPATFGKVVRELELKGTVIQSHVNSPRTTAYLAMLLSRNSRINNLIVFGAGSRKEEYCSYLSEIGVTNVLVQSEKLIEVSPEANILEEVIAVFATPPNSYSAINDPIDLVCSRGGDLSMLEVLTESEITEEGRDRVTGILDEQRKTLKYAMSRPQIQFVLYETHSELSIENQDMVQRTMKDINKITTLKHAALQGKLKVDPMYSDLLLQEINNNETIKIEIFPSDDSIFSESSKQPSLISKTSIESVEAFENVYKDVLVPNCDLFDQPDLPILCSNNDDCLNLLEQGCYLALIKRKEVTNLDNKYMIEMAEVRGVFGSTSSTTRTKGSRTSKAKKQEKRLASPPLTKNKRKSRQLQIERIAAPTQSSSNRTFQSCCSELQPCPKVQKEEDTTIPKVPQSRRWWTETTQHLKNLKQSLVHKNIVSNVKLSFSQPLPNAKKHSLKSLQIDEIVAKSSEGYKIPIFPRLRLTRNTRLEKIPLPTMGILTSVVEEMSSVTRKWEEYKIERDGYDSDIEETPEEENLKFNKEDELFFHGLKMLTESKEKLKDIVSSRLPYQYYKKLLPQKSKRSLTSEKNESIQSISDHNFNVELNIPVKQTGGKQPSPKENQLKLSVVKPIFFPLDRKI
ncbi:hypothetical protein RN001_006969 [Aquatica leii]|uniref:Uncharacterized protein n=1 Tax=Aquatica leii TaxID=1421715 RepID=A0AAN7SSC6_9COLE|nr:hypothetical protein RN001_006969 [Aquatica leii]